MCPWITAEVQSDMSPVGSLAGRLGRIRPSNNGRKQTRQKSESVSPLPLPWKPVKPFVSMNQEVFDSPFTKDSIKFDSPQLFPGMEYKDIGNLIFYDLETTGLSGGAGTISFLAGFGWIEKNKLIINQYFLHDFPGEIDFLLLINELLVPGKILVSYNGKSFDHPLLRTRFLMKGLKLNELPEIDLLHTARRLWKNRLPSCRLGVIENSILGIHRVGDIPGIEIPDIYFNYLKNGKDKVNNNRLGGVFRHHLQDIKSLSELLAYMEFLWSNPGDASVIDRTALGKLLLLRNRKEGEELLKDSWLCEDYDAGKFLSIHYKRKGNYAEAAEIWKKMWQTKTGIFQGIELAKYYEHKTKDIESALSIVGSLLCEDSIKDNSKIMEALEHRLKRLERKVI